MGRSELWDILRVGRFKSRTFLEQDVLRVGRFKSRTFCMCTMCSMTILESLVVRVNFLDSVQILSDFRDWELVGYSTNSERVFQHNGE